MKVETLGGCGDTLKRGALTGIAGHGAGRSQKSRYSCNASRLYTRLIISSSQSTTTTTIGYSIFFHQYTLHCLWRPPTGWLIGPDTPIGSFHILDYPALRASEYLILSDKAYSK